MTESSLNPLLTTKEINETSIVVAIQYIVLSE